jgi:ABC-type sugar transport system substrate-binding protein
VAGTLTAAVAALALLVAACGSNKASTSGSTGGSGGATPKHITIGYVDGAISDAAEHQWWAWFSSAAASIGWTTTLFDANGVTTDIPRGILQFVNQKVDAIVVGCDGAEMFANAVQAARAAKIPIIEVGCLDDTGGKLYNAWYGEPDQEMTQVLAQKMVSDLKPGDQVAIIGTDIIEATRLRAQILTQRLTSAGIKVVKYAQPTNLADPQEPGRIASNLLNSYPDLKAIVTTANSFAPSIVTTLQQIGKNVPLYSFNMDALQLPLLKPGSPLVAITDGPTPILCLQAASDLLAYFQKGTPLSYHGAFPVPGVRIFTQTSHPALTSGYLGPANIHDYLPSWIKKWNTTYGFHLTATYANFPS